MFIVGSGKATSIGVSSPKIGLFLSAASVTQCGYFIELLGLMTSLSWLVLVSRTGDEG